jgi:hypothetical protein
VSDLEPDIDAFIRRTAQKAKSSLGETSKTLVRKAMMAEDEEWRSFLTRLDERRERLGAMGARAGDMIREDRGR